MTASPVRDDFTESAFGPPPAPNADRDAKGRYVFARYTIQNDHYAGFFQTWTKAILFLCGRQWNLVWSASRRTWSKDTDIPAWRQQPVTNLVYAVYRTLAAKLTKQKPTLEVVPPSGDSDDRAAAELGQALLVHLWRALGLSALYKRAIGWFLTTGQVYLRVHWDPEAGKRLPVTRPMPHPDPTQEDIDCPCDEDGTPYLDANGQPDLSKAPAVVPEGEIAVTVVDPLSVRFDPEAVDAETACEMFVGRLLTKAKAKALYKLEDADLEPAGQDMRQDYDDLVAAAATGPGWLGFMSGGNTGVSSRQGIGERVLAIEYYAKPDEDAPEGRHWITIGQKVVWPAPTSADYPNGEAPLPGGFWPPLVPVLALPIPGQPQAMGVLPQIVPLNESLNVLDGKISEHEILMAMGGKWIVSSADAGLVITSDPGQKLISKGYDLGRPPTQGELKALPAEVYAERSVLMEKVRTVASLSEADFGQKPEGVSAGRAFLVLQEVSDSSLGPDLRTWEQATEEVGRRMLVLAQQHYTDKRTIAIRGERGKWEIRSFTNADLADGLDVRVQQGSASPWSATAQADFKLEVASQFKEMFLKPDGTFDQSAFARFMDTTGTGLQTLQSDEDPDQVEIEREHAEFEVYDPAKGEETVPEIAFWQDHAKHLDGHTRFMKRDYGRFQRWSPEAQIAFVEHIRMTMAAVSEQVQTAIDAANPPPGQPPQGPGMNPGGPAATSTSVTNALDTAADTNEPGATGDPATQQPMLGSADYASAGAGEPALVGA